jgi:hypothetical protein
MCDFNLDSRQIMEDSLEKQWDPNLKRDTFSFLDNILENDPERLKVLIESGLGRETNQIYHDMFIVSPIGRCFELTKS